MLRVFRIPIRLKWKFLIGILDLVLLFGAIHIYLVKMHLGKSLQQELYLRLKPLAASIGNSAVPMLLRDERVELHQLLMDAKEKDPSLRYGAIIGRGGDVVIHTFGPEGVPQNLFSANGLTPDRQEHYVRIQDARRLYQTYLDVAYPLGEQGKFGTLRLGMDESGIRYTLTHIILSILLMILLFVVLGFAGALILAWWVNRPIREIQSAIRRFDLSSPVPSIDVQTGDELEDFGRSVESMMRRLKKNDEQMDALRTSMFRAERVAALGTLAAGISHEIRNPLAGLINCLKRLSRKPDEANLREYLPLMNSASRQIDDTVSRYLRFSSAPSAQPKPFCVNDSTQVALALVRPRLESRTISVQVDLEEGLPTVHGDPTLLQQVLLNLLINAVDAIDKEGTISLKTFRNNTNVVLMVGDTGSGIREEDIQRLFDPFFTTKEGSGSGLGLTISKEIVKRLQGTIRVESQLGKGTTFRIELPADKE